MQLRKAAKRQLFEKDSPDIWVQGEQTVRFVERASREKAFQKLTRGALIDGMSMSPLT